jgi:hypothetical protein
MKENTVLKKSNDRKTKERKQGKKKEEKKSARLFPLHAFSCDCSSKGYELFG